MNYSDLLERSWAVLWRHKFILVLGIMLAAFTSGETFGALITNRLRRLLPMLPDAPTSDSPLADLPIRLAQRLFTFAGQFGIPGLIGAVLFIVIVLTLFAVLVLWVRSTIIAGASQAQSSSTTMGVALGLAWGRLWRLIIIVSIPPIPITIAGIVWVMISWVILYFAGGRAVFGDPMAHRTELIIILILALVLALPFSLLTSGLTLLSHIAERACIVENRKAVESFYRAWSVIRANMSTVIIVAVIHAGISLILRVVLALPRLAIGIFPILTPLLWIVLGVVEAFFLVMWTLAWHEWTSPQSSE